MNESNTHITRSRSSSNASFFGEIHEEIQIVVDNPTAANISRFTAKVFAVASFGVFVSTFALHMYPIAILAGIVFVVACIYLSYGPNESAIIDHGDEQYRNSLIRIYGTDSDPGRGRIGEIFSIFGSEEEKLKAEKEKKLLDDQTRDDPLFKSLPDNLEFERK